MAKDRDDKGRPIFARTPNQAVRVFGLDHQNWYGSPNGGTAAVPRPKFLFMVRFVRGPGQGSPKWRDGLTFAVKTFDRPTMAPKVQTLNQYNKKRVVQTGIDYQAVSIDFHDTTDTVVSAMWQEYASYYFGDFRRSSQSDWTYDITMPEFNDTAEGFGLTLPPGDKNSVSYLEASHFFEKVECYQLFGNHFTRFDLVHPKISRYDPDDMSYENGNQSHGIRMSMEFEAVIEHANGNLIPIKSSEFLSSLFGDVLNGQVYDPPSENRPSPLTKNIPFYGNMTRVLTKLPGGYVDGLNKINQTTNKVKQIAAIPGAVGGALSSFGSFNFGENVPPDSVLGKVINGTSTNVTGSSGINATNAIKASVSVEAYDAAKIRAENDAAMAAHIAASKNNASVISTWNSNSSATNQIGYRATGPKPPDDLGDIYG